MKRRWTLLTHSAKLNGYLSAFRSRSSNSGAEADPRRNPYASRKRSCTAAATWRALQDKEKTATIEWGMAIERKSTTWPPQPHGSATVVT